MSIEVSVIVPVYNVAGYLPQCLDSLLRQPHAPAFEIILVDDGSTDSSGAICDRYATGATGKEGPAIRVIHQKNAGLPAARNAGLAVARGRYIQFVDSDDFVAADLLAVCHRALQENPGADLVQFACRYTDADGKLLGRVKGPRKAALYTGMDRYGRDRNYFPVAWGYMVRRSVLEDNSLTFNASLRNCEDEDFTLRLLSLTRGVVTLTEPLYMYRQRPGSIMARKGNLTLMRYQLTVAEGLIRYFTERDPQWTRRWFLRKRVTQIVMAFLKRLAYLPSCERPEATSLWHNFLAATMALTTTLPPGTPPPLLPGFNLRLARVSLPLFIRFRRLLK